MRISPSTRNDGTGSGGTNEPTTVPTFAYWPSTAVPLAEQVIVADGKQIWLYDPELEQVTVRRLDDTLSATPAMLLSGEGKLRDNFKVVSAKREDNVDWVTLEPVRPDTDFKSVTLGFVGAELRHMQLADKLNQTTSLEFADGSLAEVVAESFRGKTRVQQHKMVYDALKGNMGGALHALALQTSVPD